MYLPWAPCSGSTEKKHVKTLSLQPQISHVKVLPASGGAALAEQQMLTTGRRQSQPQPTGELPCVLRPPKSTWSRSHSTCSLWQLPWVLSARLSTRYSPVALFAILGTGNGLRVFKHLPQSFTASTWLIQDLNFDPFDPCESCSIVSDSLWPHGLYSSWNTPGQNTGVGSLSCL